MGSLGLLFAAGAGAVGGYVAGQRRALAERNPTATAGAGRPRPLEQDTSHDTAEEEPLQRLVHVARIRQGSEADVRRLVEERFPVTALYEPGIRELSTYVGSTYVLSEYGFHGAFDAVFNAFRANPAVAAYLQELGQLLDDEPAPLPDAAGHQYLASQALHWDSTAGLSFTPWMREKAASSE